MEGRGIGVGGRDGGHRDAVGGGTVMERGNRDRDGAGGRGMRRAWDGGNRDGGGKGGGGLGWRGTGMKEQGWGGQG